MKKPIQTSIIMAFGLLATVGCSSWQSVCPDFVNLTPAQIDGWPNLDYSKCPPPKPVVTERQRLFDELAAAQKQNDALSSRVRELERQLADRDREIASLRSGAGDSSKLSSQLAAANSRNSALEAQLAAMSGVAAGATASQQRVAELERQLAARDKELEDLRGTLSAEMQKLKEAQRGLIRALRSQITKGDIMIDLNNERLLINLASSYLFGSGQDELRPAGIDALKHVGRVLKDFPEYKVAVDGHTDNVPIRGELKKKFPTNMELSESRAVNAAKALTEGGLAAPTTHGYADTRPDEPNTTAAGRAKNRRIEVRVTK